MRHPQQFLFAGRIGPVGIIAGNAEAGEDRGEGHFLGRILHEELAVLLELRVEGQAQQPLLVFPVEVMHLLRQIEEDLRLG